MANDGESNVISSSSNSNTYKNIGWKDLNKWKFYTFMPAISITAHSIYYPAALVKTRIQTATATGDVQYKSTRDAFRSIYRSEGVKAFYKGFGISLIGLLNGPIYMTTLEITKEKIDTFAKTFIASEQTCAFIASSVGAATALLVVTSIATPIDVVSQRTMVQRAKKTADATSEQKFQPPKEIIKAIYAKEKIRGFYRGYWPTLANRLPTGALCWGSYSVYHTALREYFYPSELTGTIRVIRDVALIPFVAGASAGATGAAITFPLDLIRTRIQVSKVKKTFFQTGGEVISQYGIRGLYTGITARILHLGITYSIIFPAYEILKKISTD